MVSEVCFDDLHRGKKRIEEKLQGQYVQEELAYAQSRAEMILSNDIVWKMLKDLAEYMVNTIYNGQKEAEGNALTTNYWFARIDIYKCFERTLTGGEVEKNA